MPLFLWLITGTSLLLQDDFESLAQELEMERKVRQQQADRDKSPSIQE
uniref:Uncharacterized protein n=1 Tax=Rhodnius prolixus TaxID=13249 RepID=T1I4K0_RHOPR